MEVETKAIVPRRPRHKVREGWAEGSKSLAGNGDDALAMGEFANADDAELTW